MWEFDDQHTTDSLRRVCITAPAAGTNPARCCIATTSLPISTPSIASASSPPAMRRTDSRTREFRDALSRSRTASAPCSTCRCSATTADSACCAPSTSAAPAHLDRRRAELRHLGRQSDRRGDRRGTAAAGAGPAGGERCARAPDRRHRARCLHRHRLGTAGSWHGTRRPRRRSDGRAKRSSAGAWSRRSSRRHSATAHQRHAPLPRRPARPRSSISASS